MANIICSLINIGILSAAQPLIPVQLVDDEQMENAVGTAYFMFKPGFFSETFTFTVILKWKMNITFSFTVNFHIAKLFLIEL